jgi:TolB protein
MKKTVVLAVTALAAAVVRAQAVVDISGAGVAKKSVAINVPNADFAKSLRKNLELSGLFIVQAKAGITVAGTPGAAVRVTGDGKTLTSTEAVSDAKSARMAARRLADAMCQAYGNQKGFACDRIAFVNRKGSDNAELCMCYPDGYDIRQLTSDAKATVGPRWKTAQTLYYTGFLNAGPQVYELDVETGRRVRPWSFKGLATGAAVSPDGTKVAIILSFQGNPELYVLQGGRYLRLTNTPNATEGQPSWSPDGKKLVYVSDETRRPQLYIIDVATREKRRLTSKGSQNVDPDWGDDGRIAYITKRGGAQIAVLNPADGEGAARLVTQPGSWEHPSWSRDRRHVVASRDKALFVVDTLEDGDKPRQVFHANGNWITPSWSR